MRVARRRLLAASAAGAGCVLATGCVRREPAALRFWAMGREGEVAGALVEGFERENPGVRVRVEQLPWSAAHEKLLTAFAGDATPDLAQMGNTWLAEMAALGAIAPLEPWLQATPSVDPADHFPGIWATNQVGGAVVGIPWYVDTRLLFVRRDLLAQAGFTDMPEDWAGWRRCLAAVKAGGVATPILLPINEFEPLLALALQQEEPVLREEGRHGNFSGPGFRRALDFYLGLFRDGYAPGVTHNQVSNLWQEFDRGMFAMFVSGPWNIGELQRRLPAARQRHWGTAALPGPTGPGASIAGGSSLVLFRRSRMQPLAWRLVEYLSRPHVQAEFHQLTGNLPPRRSSWAIAGRDGRALQDEPHARAFRLQLGRVRAAPAVPEWERIVQTMQAQAAQAVHGRLSAQEAVRALDTRVDAILEKRRWMLARGARG
ncbi:MAG: hypothetical protein RI988_134 [Pseudomonadota bacterium]|jgi:multiple sugar transport system substrate-binding protein